MVPQSDIDILRGNQAMDTKCIWIYMYRSHNYAIPCWYIKLCGRLLDQWLKCTVKSFSKPLSQDHRRNMASSNSLLASKFALEKTILFLSFQMDQVKASHQQCHLLFLTPVGWTPKWWWKCCCGLNGKAPLTCSHDMVSHHMGWTLLQWKKRWDASSCWVLQRGQSESVSWICLLYKFFLVGSLSLNNLHANTRNLAGTFILQSFSKHSSWLLSVASSPIKS